MISVKARKSNMELMRIVCMLIILLSHYAVHGGFNFPGGISLNRTIIQTLSTFGQIGVLGFVLITGYFQVDCEFKAAKLKSIWGQVLFYSILCFGLGCIFVSRSYLTGNNIVKAIFPVITVEYWYATTYMALYFLSPYINSMIKSISEKDLRKLIIFLIVIWYIMLPFFGTGNIGSTSLGLFIVSYLVGAYFKLYPLSRKRKRIICILGGVLYIGLILYMLLLDILSLNYQFLAGYINYFIHLNSICILGAAVSLFIIFDSMDFRCKVINYYAGYMFPLYLFHDNEYMRELLWIRLFKNRDFGYSKLIIVHIAICVIVILLMSFGIEFGRKKLFEFGKKTIGKCMVKDEGK